MCTCRHEAFRQRTEWNIGDEPTLGEVCYIPGVEYRTGQVLSRAATGGLQTIAGPAALEGRTVWVILPWYVEVPLNNNGGMLCSLHDMYVAYVCTSMTGLTDIQAVHTWQDYIYVMCLVAIIISTLHFVPTNTVYSLFYVYIPVDVSQRTYVCTVS